MAGPLAGVRIVEMAGIGPGPMCAMLLADLGADIVRIDRLAPAELGLPRDPAADPLLRGRRSVAVDLKQPEGVSTVMALVSRADALIEGFRPGVMERLGLAPQACLAENPRLVYGRMTGWGQDGPLAQAAGHDINYIALVGVLDAIGREGEAPVHPLNLVGDFGGGALYLVMGVLAGLIEAGRSGRGQVIDCAMTDGAASLMTLFYGMKHAGRWRERRGTNAIDGGSHFYNVYETRDGRHISLGAIEPKFYAELLDKLGLDHSDLPAQHDRTAWPEMKARFAAVFRTRTRDEWCELLEGSDTCFAPVLNLSESLEHPHNRARHTFVSPGGVPQPAPAPRFSRTPCELTRPPAASGGDSRTALLDWGFDADRVRRLEEAGAIRQAPEPPPD